MRGSFRNYVDAAGGSVKLDDGATLAEDGSFVFAAWPGGDLVIEPDGRATGAMRLQGSITFEAHGGTLKSALTELGLKACSDGLNQDVHRIPV